MTLGKRLAGRILEHLVSQTADKRYRDHLELFLRQRLVKRRDGGAHAFV